ncbi:glutamine-tRNA ligase [Cyphellophora europaea CBS 101466]|uniref:glutamine--tRNA ligase n=1 Tax=Cyphellophora europaea (strain CBS 101466) TaxID=1220924 RepID=W2S410_CYPE1|nr:glutamine-tRNA ligase [Cyphellophora europaea CBS 101466]ETN43426.1 glutamine-tRNA ligase [Cyphellophora europaea CBS 101466]
MEGEAGSDKSLPERVKEVVKENIPGTTEKKEKKEKKPKAPKPPKDPNAKPANVKPPKPAKTEPAAPLDPDAMFKEGWLAGVRKERPEDETVCTRFPPEPNGYLHIGHSKAIAVNFGFARHYGGTCNLRYDDTNPEAEEEIYFVKIEEIVRWLGFDPARITYSSDSFDKLYELAEKLISVDGAYVCHCTPDDLKDQRGGTDVKNKKPRYACVHRSRPIEESLAEFRAMKDGKYKPGEAFLRMKTDDFKNGNPQMWDLVAYRILEKPHHRTGDKWRIYPTYDFTHCLCDSFEGITHSLCTTEFILSRESYEWLNNTVDVPHKPMQREYGRLNIGGTVLSKRKIKKLVDDKYVSGWDDPRLYTLVALRRRGVPPGAILSFVNELGVTTAKINIQIVRFEQSVRKYLEMSTPRLMLVLDPIKVIIDDLPDDYIEEIENAFGPKDVDMGLHKMPFTKTVYIDRDDFREEDSKDFFRMAPGKPVGLLKVPFPITAKSFTKDESTGLVTEIHATYDKPPEGEKFKKPKAYIQWVAESPAHRSPVKAEARIVNPLFKSDNPDDVEPSFLADIREDSLKIFPNAMVEVGFNEIEARRPWPQEAGESKPENCGPESVRFQAMRIGYFCMDKDTTKDKVILNRIVSLKEDAGKTS